MYICNKNISCIYRIMYKLLISLYSTLLVTFEYNAVRRTMRFFYLVINSVITNEYWFFHYVSLDARCILNTPRCLRIATQYAHCHLYFFYKHKFPWILFPVIYLNKESRWKTMACDVIIPTNVYYTCWFY